MSALGVILLAVQAAAGTDARAASLIARARERHRALDAAVRDYQATVRTRIDVALSRGVFARALPFAAVEQEAILQWQAPNDVRVAVIGQRTRTALPATRVGMMFGRPWFIPRFMGDSIRLVDDDFPHRAAIHPLAEGADTYYRFAIVDSLELALPGQTVRAIGVRVTPTRADAALIAGTMWLDAATAETVRMTFAFVGRRLWADPEGATRRDTARAERENRRAARVLNVTADLEYGLFDGRYWLPFRQSLTLNVRLPWVSDLAIPVNFITTFRNLRVNQGTPITFTIPMPDTGTVEWRDPGDGLVSVGAGGRSARERAAARRDSLDRDSSRVWRMAGRVNAGRWPGGRFEVVTPPETALAAYGAWSDSLTLDVAPGDAERMEAARRELMATLERLPTPLSGARPFGFAVDRMADIARFNRGEGLSLGAGVAARTGLPFTAAFGRLRYAVTDQRLQGAAGLRRDAPGARTEVTMFREMRDADPLAPGLTLTNSVSSLLLAHDQGSYVFMEGAELRLRRAWARRADLTFVLRAARESAPRRPLRSVWTGDFPPPEPALGGSFVTATALADGGRADAHWFGGVDASAGDRTRVRAWAGGSRRFEVGAGVDVAIAGWAGTGVGDSVPQRDFRLGGAHTLRGFDAGRFRGKTAWNLGVDIGAARRVVSPVVFVDVGGAAGGAEATAGAGLSVLRGVLRLHVATPLSRAADWRFDVVFGAHR